MLQVIQNSNFYRRCCLALLVAGMSLVAVAAQAIPTTYQIDSALSSADVTVSIGSMVLASAAPLNITGSFITFDPDTPQGALLDFDITADGSIVLAGGAVSAVQIVSASLTPGALAFSNTGGGCDVLGCSATYFGTVNTVAEINLGAGALPFAGASLATVGVNTGAPSIELSLTGITLGSFAELDQYGLATGRMIEVKGDLNIVGAVPEPSAALLFLVGTVVVSARSRRI